MTSGIIIIKVVLIESGERFANPFPSLEDLASIYLSLISTKS
jgi:hypothetical protein